MTINSAVSECKDAGLKSWELVEYAQRLVSREMCYSYTNSRDMPDKAFEKGVGYCWQQAGALNHILKELGFNSRIVHAFKNEIPEKAFEGVTIKKTYFRTRLVQGKNRWRRKGRMSRERGKQARRDSFQAAHPGQGMESSYKYSIISRLSG